MFARRCFRVRPSSTVLKCSNPAPTALPLGRALKSDNPSFQNEHFPREFHQKWQSTLPKRAFSTRSTLPKRAFSTRPSQRVTIQASKTSVLHETSRKSELRSKHSAMQIPMSQRGSTPLKHHSETANPNMTTTQTCHFRETLRLRSDMHHLSCVTHHLCANHNAIAAQTATWHIHEMSGLSLLECSFWELGLSLLVNVSWKMLVLEVVTFGEILVENAHFGSLDCHFWWKSRGKCSFWKLGLSLLVNVSWKMLVLEASKSVLTRESSKSV